MRISKGLLATTLGRVLDIMPKASGLLMSKWVHATIDCVRHLVMLILGGTVGDGTGSIVLYTVPEGKILQLLGVFCGATSGTWTASKILLQLKSTGSTYPFPLKVQAAAATIQWEATHEGLSLHAGDIIRVYCDVDTSGVAEYEILGRLFDG
jgi:hypothetical protein